MQSTAASAVAVRPPLVPLVEPGQVKVWPGDMTATFAFDLTVAQLRARLAEVGQWIPLDAPGHARVGELVLRNNTGPLRLGFGGWRDLLLGCQFRDGRGRLITVGGRVVKNVAGYDLTKFIVGSFGCFGTPLTFTARTYKKPHSVVVASLDADSTALLPLLREPTRPNYALLRTDLLHLGWLGDEQSVRFFEQFAQTFGPRARIVRSIEEDDHLRGFAWSASLGGGTFRAVVPPTRVQQLCRALPDERFAADAAHGVVVGHCDTPEKLEAIVTPLQGRLVCFDSLARPLRLKLDPGEADLLRRLKREFDPDHTLANLPLD